MSRLWRWGSLLTGALVLALVWWGWQHVGLAGLQLEVGSCL